MLLRTFSSWAAVRVFPFRSFHTLFTVTGRVSKRFVTTTCSLVSAPGIEMCESSLPGKPLTTSNNPCESAFPLEFSITSNVAPESGTV